MINQFSPGRALTFFNFEAVEMPKIPGASLKDGFYYSSCGCVQVKSGKIYGQDGTVSDVPKFYYQFDFRPCTEMDDPPADWSDEVRAYKAKLHKRREMEWEMRRKQEEQEHQRAEAKTSRVIEEIRRSLTPEQLEVFDRVLDERDQY